MGFGTWLRNRFRKKEKVTTTPIPASRVEGKDSSGKPAPIVGDTPSGYVDKAPTPTTGTTTVRYGRRGGGGSSRTVVTPTGETYEQTPEQAQKGENLPPVQEAKRLLPGASSLGGAVFTRQEIIDRGIKPQGDAQAYTISSDQMQPQTGWQRFKTGLNKVLYPLDTPTTVWRGGKGIPREEYNQLSDAGKKAMFFTPENILLFAQYPAEPKPTQVEFAGIKQTTKNGKTVTGLKYSASTGDKGTAVGISKHTGKVGNVYTSDTVVSGSSYKGKVYDLVTGKLIKQNQQLFTGAEGSLYIKQGNQFVQVGKGGSASYNFGTNTIKANNYNSVDMGLIDNAFIKSFGGSQTTTGVTTYSKGIIVNADKLAKGGTPSGSTFTVGAGKGSTITTGLSQQTIANLATQSIVRASITPAFPWSATIAPPVSQSIGAIGSQTIGKTSTKQVSPTPVPRQIPTENIAQQFAPTITKTIQPVDTDTIITPVTGLGGRSRGSTRVVPITTTIPAVTPITTPAVTPTTAPPILITPTVLVPGITPGGGFGGGFGGDSPGGGRGIPFLPPFGLGSFGFGGSSKTVPFKQTFKYTPDYTSLITGTRGAKGKSITGNEVFAGFETRPITKDWGSMFTNSFGIGKKRKKKKKK